MTTDPKPRTSAPGRALASYVHRHDRRTLQWIGLGVLLATLAIWIASSRGSTMIAALRGQ